MIEKIEYGHYQIEYNVEFRNRKTLEIAVLPDRSVCLKVPLNTPDEKIKERVQRRASWILKQLRYFEQFAIKTPPRHYLGGETHLYLGKQYRLKLLTTPTTSVKLLQGFIIICSPDLSSLKVKNILEQYYRRRAKEKFVEYLDRVSKKMGIAQLPKMQIRAMKTNWGSLSPKGILSLNPELIKAPPQCLEYVITHELCHMHYRDHDADFYRELEHLLPDWKKRKNKLEIILI